MVDTQWIENTEALYNLPQQPDFLFVQEPEDIAVYTALLDAQFNIRPIGPYTWVHNLPSEKPAKVDVYAELLGMETTIGNGPWLALQRVNDAEESDQIEVSIDFAAPSWMHVTTIDLITANDEVLHSWTVDGTNFSATIGVPAHAWLIAKAYGSEPVEQLHNKPAWGFTVLH